MEELWSFLWCFLPAKLAKNTIEKTSSDLIESEKAPCAYVLFTIHHSSFIIHHCPNRLSYDTGHPISNHDITCPG